MFVQVDPDKHSQDAQDVHLDAESQGQLYEDEIDRERGTDTWRKVGGEDALNRALRGHHMKDFT